MKAHAGRWALGLTVGAFAWAVALIVAALAVPVYSGVSSTGTSSSTLVDENGAACLVVVALPALTTAIAWAALHRRCSRGSRRATWLAWAMVYGLAAFAILGAASIGMFVLPVALLLGAAAALTPYPAG
jgi:hypothetical protein